MRQMLPPASRVLEGSRELAGATQRVNEPGPRGASSHASISVRYCYACALRVPAVPCRHRRVRAQVPQLKPCRTHGSVCPVKTVAVSRATRGLSLEATAGMMPLGFSHHSRLPRDHQAGLGWATGGKGFPTFVAERTGAAPYRWPNDLALGGAPVMSLLRVHPGVAGELLPANVFRW